MNWNQPALAPPRHQCVWGKITLRGWQFYEAKTQAWPSAVASRCNVGLGRLGVHFAHTISKSTDLYDKTRCIKEFGWKLQLQSQCLSGPFRRYTQCDFSVLQKHQFQFRMLLWFHMSQRLGTGHWMGKDWKRMGRHLLVALAWLPLTDTACFVLSLMVLENQRSATFSAKKLSKLLQRRNKYWIHICLVEFVSFFRLPCCQVQGEGGSETYAYGYNRPSRAKTEREHVVCTDPPPKGWGRIQRVYLAYTRGTDPKWTAYKRNQVIRKYGPWMDFWMLKGIRKIPVKKTWTKYVVEGSEASGSIPKRGKNTEKSLNRRRHGRWPATM